jgi:hypothetical protein
MDVGILASRWGFLYYVCMYLDGKCMCVCLCVFLCVCSPAFCYDGT